MKKFLFPMVVLLSVHATVDAGPLARLFGRGQPSRAYQPQQVQQQAVQSSVVQQDSTPVSQTPAAWTAYPYQSPPAYRTVQHVQHAPLTHSMPARFMGGTICVTGR